MSPWRPRPCRSVEDEARQAGAKDCVAPAATRPMASTRSGVEIDFVT